MNIQSDNNNIFFNNARLDFYAIKEIQNIYEENNNHKNNKLNNINDPKKGIESKNRLPNISPTDLENADNMISDNTLLHKQQNSENHFVRSYFNQNYNINTIPNLNLNSNHTINNEKEKKKNEFPINFNPRKTPNMPSKEKINKWMKNIPYYYDDNDQIIFDYFPAVATSTSSTCDSNKNIDLSETDAIIEHQARKVTRFATKLYVNEDESVFHAEKSSNEYYDSDGKIMNFNDDVQEHDTSFSYFHEKKKSKYLIQKSF